MRDWESAIETAIREAQERGEFDNLPNQGKPQDLTPNPYAPDMDMAHRLLKDQGFAPAWIEDDKEIRSRLSEARARVLAAWQRFQERLLAADFLAPARRSQERRGAAIAWLDARRRFADEIEQLNARIRLFNLTVPIVSKQRVALDLAREFSRVGIADRIPEDITIPAAFVPEPSPDEAAPEGERGLLQDALYRMIQGREKMPLSPLWHNARRSTIFRYIERLQRLNREDEQE